MVSGRKIRQRLLTGLLLGALSLAATSAGAVDYFLAAKQFNMTMPDGTSVPMWGYVADPGGACYNAANNAARLTCVNGLSAPTVPGPRLTVTPNDAGNALRIFLSNGLSVPTSIVIPGQEMPFTAANNGPTWNDGSFGARPNAAARVRSFGREAAASGGRQDYIWNNTRSNPFQIGTFTYHSGTHPQVQVQMGLYGAVSRDMAAGQAYSGVPYDTARDLFYSEVDPALHAAVANGTYGTAPTSTLNYQPKYFLLQSYNGSGLPVDVSIDPTQKACINGGIVTGQRTLLRLYNAGLRELAPMMIGSHFDLVAEGGKKAPYAQRQYQLMLMPGSTRDVVFTPTEDGTFPLIERRLNLTDNMAMNGGAQTCLTVAGTNAAPTITSTPVTTAIVGVAYTYTVNATDPDAGQTLTYSLDGTPPAGMSINASTGLISWTPGAGQAGANNVTVRVTDNGTPALFATQSFVVTVNQPPSITSIPVTTATVGVAYLYDVNATDSAGQTLTYSLDVAPAGMSINSGTGLITWPAPVVAGSPHNVTVRVTDNGTPSLFATQSFVVTVAAANQPPSITSIPVTTATVGVAYSYDVDATDSAGQTLTYSLDVAPAGMSINSGTGLITWPAPVVAGSPHNVTVRVTDNGIPALFATQSFTVTVTPAPPVNLIFADGFESGSFAAWSFEQDVEIDLTVSAAAALAGSAFGMQAVIDNNTAMWVQNNSPANETRYRARFYFDPNSIPMANQDVFRLMVARNADVTGAGGLDIVRITLRRFGGNYQIQASTNLDNGSFSSTGWYTIPDAPVAIEIDWQASSSPVANNGHLSLWTAGVLRQTLGGLNNDTRRVESVRLGPHLIEESTRGTVYFDAFVSTRIDPIGP